MAHDQGGMFSVRRQPRETLSGLPQNITAIPMPTSAMKRSNSISNTNAPLAGNHARSTSGSRMSLAPGSMMRPSQPKVLRSSSGENLVGMGNASVQRHSTANLFGSAAGRKSIAPGSTMIAQTPASGLSAFDLNSQRRSSVFKARSSAGMGAPIGGHQSFFQTVPPSGTTPTDPRNLRSGPVRKQMADELTAYLAEHNFDMTSGHTLSPNWTTSPTQKDFNSLFMWMYHRFDPSYRFQKSLDVEVTPLLKQLRYPWANNITKSQIGAVGGNNWATFLGLLHWMMQLAKMMELYASGEYDFACAAAGFDVGADRIVFDFLSSAYLSWLQVDDDADEEEAERAVQPHIEAMAATFDKANEQNLEDMEILEAEHKALQDQIDELGKNGPRLAKLDEQIKVLESDRVKFEEYNKNMDLKIQKYENRAKLYDDEIRKIEEELKEAEQEKDELQALVDKQGLSITDIDRMNAERERLQKGVETTNVRLEESKKKVAEKAMEATAKLDELELAIEKYNTTGYQVAVIPKTAANARGQDFELILQVNEGPDFRGSQLGSSQSPDADRLLADSGNGYQRHHLLNLDIKGNLKQAISALRKEIRERREQANETDIKNHDMLDQVKEALDDKQSEVEALSHKVRAAEEELEKTKEITAAQKMASDAQIERMEKELAKMRTGLSESVQLMEQREINTNIAYEQLTLKASALREELHTEIERMLNDVIRFKVHIQEGLENYEGFVADEVEKEMEQEQGMGAEES